MAKKPASKSKAKAKKTSKKAETTAKKQLGPGGPQLIPFQFKPGVSGNPAGRPPGTRNKFCKKFIEDMATVWEEANQGGHRRGLNALRTIADEKPVEFDLLAGFFAIAWPLPGPTR